MTTPHRLTTGCFCLACQHRRITRRKYFQRRMAEKQRTRTVDAKTTY